MLKILPYKIGSKSARALARALGVLRIHNPRYRQKRRDIIMNWGTSHPVQLLRFALNQPAAVAKASDKLVALQALKAASIPCPDFTTSHSEAAGWLRQQRRVVVRHLLSSHSGNGTQVVEPMPTQDECLAAMPEAPLYTKYFRRDAEFRVHVFRGEVIDYVHKKRRRGYENDPNFNPYVRTHRHGWVFAREGVQLPTCCSQAAIAAVSALGLDFGAVDTLYRAPESCVVLEVNTAPGVEGTTLQKYVGAVRKYLTRF